MIKITKQATLKKASGSILDSAESKSGIISNAIARTQRAKDAILSATFVALFPTIGIHQLENSSVAKDLLFDSQLIKTFLHIQ